MSSPNCTLSRFTPALLQSCPILTRLITIFLERLQYASTYCVGGNIFHIFEDPAHTSSSFIVLIPMVAISMYHRELFSGKTKKKPNKNSKNWCEKQCSL